MTQMTVELRVPQLGESITEAVVGKWNKNVGDAVAVDEPVVVLETDKVTIDVQAPAAGAIAAITHPTGTFPASRTNFSPFNSARIPAAVAGESFAG